MTKRSFSFAALMSIATGRNLAPTLDEQYDLLRHLTGSGVVGGGPDGRMHYERARELLFPQFPLMKAGEMQFASGELTLLLETEEGRRNTDKLILGWLSQQSLRLQMDMHAPIEVSGI